MAAMKRTSMAGERVRADASHLAALDHAGAAWPGWTRGSSPISSRKMVPPCGLLEQATLVARRAGEGAPLVPEELALEQPFGQRRAVDGDEGGRGAAALPVDPLGEACLADAGLAEQHHREAAPGDGVHEPFETRHHAGVLFGGRRRVRGGPQHDDHRADLDRRGGPDGHRRACSNDHAIDARAVVAAQVLDGDRVTHADERVSAGDRLVLDAEGGRLAPADDHFAAGRRHRQRGAPPAPQRLEGRAPTLPCSRRPQGDGLGAIGVVAGGAHRLHCSGSEARATLREPLAPCDACLRCHGPGKELDQRDRGAEGTGGRRVRGPGPHRARVAGAGPARVRHEPAPGRGREGAGARALPDRGGPQALRRGGPITSQLEHPNIPPSTSSGSTGRGTSTSR